MIIYRLSLFFTPVSFRWTIPLNNISIGCSFEIFTSRDRMPCCTDELIHDYDWMKYEVNDQPNLPPSY
jgi:hypothetical protein